MTYASLNLLDREEVASDPNPCNSNAVYINGSITLALISRCTCKDGFSGDECFDSIVVVFFLLSSCDAMASNSRPLWECPLVNRN